jgi:hypothetical protein
MWHVWRSIREEWFLVCCNKCYKWFHEKCMKFAPTRADDMKHFMWPSCWLRDLATTTYLRNVGQYFLTNHETPKQLRNFVLLGGVAGLVKMYWPTFLRWVVGSSSLIVSWGAHEMFHVIVPCRSDIHTFSMEPLVETNPEIILLMCFSIRAT